MKKVELQSGTLKTLPVFPFSQLKESKWDFSLILSLLDGWTSHDFFFHALFQQPFPVSVQDLKDGKHLLDSINKANKHSKVQNKPTTQDVMAYISLFSQCSIQGDSYENFISLMNGIDNFAKGGWRKDLTDLQVALKLLPKYKNILFNDKAYHQYDIGINFQHITNEKEYLKFLDYLASLERDHGMAFIFDFAVVLYLKHDILYSDALEILRNPTSFQPWKEAVIQVLEFKEKFPWTKRVNENGFSLLGLYFRILKEFGSLEKYAHFVLDQNTLANNSEGMRYYGDVGSKGKIVQMLQGSIFLSSEKEKTIFYENFYVILYGYGDKWFNPDAFQHSTDRVEHRFDVLALVKYCKSRMGKYYLKKIAAKMTPSTASMSDARALAEGISNRGWEFFPCKATIHRMVHKSCSPGGRYYTHHEKIQVLDGNIEFIQQYLVGDNPTKISSSDLEIALDYYKQLKEILSNIFFPDEYGGVDIKKYAKVMKKSEPKIGFKGYIVTILSQFYTHIKCISSLKTSKEFQDIVSCLLHICVARTLLHKFLIQRIDFHMKRYSAAQVEFNKQLELFSGALSSLEYQKSQELFSALDTVHQVDNKMLGLFVHVMRAYLYSLYSEDTPSNILRQLQRVLNLNSPEFHEVSPAQFVNILDILNDKSKNYVLSLRRFIAKKVTYSTKHEHIEMHILAPLFREGSLFYLTTFLEKISTLVLKEIELVAYPGKVQGKVYNFLDGDEQILLEAIQNDTTYKKIIICDLFKANYEQYLKYGVVGIISQEGGFTSHASIVASEYGITCVVGYTKSIKQEFLELDATSESIKLDSGRESDCKLVAFSKSKRGSFSTLDMSLYNESDPSIVWLQEISGNDYLRIVGGKALKLGILYNKGNSAITVPNGFVVTTKHFYSYLMSNNIINRQGIFNEKLKDVGSIQYAIIHGKISKEMSDNIFTFFDDLQGLSGGSSLLVAVRSSATQEDAEHSSFAGQFSSYLFQSRKHIIDSIKRCWASAFTEKVMDYMKKQHIDYDQINMAVLIIEMIEADKSGVIFTDIPTKKQHHAFIIEAIKGVAEPLVSGKIRPNYFELDQKGKLINKKRRVQHWAQGITRNEFLMMYHPMDFFKNVISSEEYILVDQEFGDLFVVAKDIENIFGIPQDIEWAIKDNVIYLLQSRPLTRK
tara:strand:- start:8375 stop:11860 length:3486 start_codon:yes stop_codon:yes gene_type:complete